MTSLQHNPSERGEAPDATTAADPAASWPSVRSAPPAANVADNENAAFDRRVTAAGQRQGQERRSLFIIGSIIAAGSLVWLLLTR